MCDAPDQSLPKAKSSPLWLPCVSSPGCRYEAILPTLLLDQVDADFNNAEEQELKQGEERERPKRTPPGPVR